MKSPSLAIGLCFAAGILAAERFPIFFRHELIAWFFAALTLLTCGFLLLSRDCLKPAIAASMLAWCALGFAAAQAESLATRSDQITRMIAQHRIDLSVPLRWRGQLRSDPLRLPYGVRYDLDLVAVQSSALVFPADPVTDAAAAASAEPPNGPDAVLATEPRTFAFSEDGKEDSKGTHEGVAWTPASGGVRLTYFFGRDPSTPPSLRAGDSVEVLARVRLVRNFGDPGAFDYRAFLARQDIYATGTLRSTELIQRIPGPAPSIAHRLARARGALLSQLDAMFANSPDRAAVARAMLLGDRGFLDGQQVETFRETGAYHVLVVAGLHVGLLAATLLWAGRKLRLPLVTRTLLTLAALGAYAGIIEDRPPIVRAALMAAIYLLARLMFRRTALLNAVGLAALAILLVQPSELTDASFLLSFLAAGVIGGMAVPFLEHTAEKYRMALAHLGDVTRDGAYVPRVVQFRLDVRAVAAWLSARVPQRLSRFAEQAITVPCRITLRIWELIVISVALQIGMLPLMAQYFNRITVVGPFSNVPAVVLAGLIVPFGFASLLLGFAWAPLGHLFARILGLLISALVASVDWFARVRWASYRVPSPPPALVIAFFAATVLLSASIIFRRQGFAWASCAVLLAFAALIASFPFAPALSRGQLEVTVLDVGQGDSIFLAFPDGKTMLVDGGGLPGGSYIRGARAGLDVGEDVVSPYLWSRGLKRIDVVALTHAHEDHLGGLTAVLRNFRVGELWIGRDVGSVAFRALLAEAAARNIPVRHLVRGDSFDWTGVHLRVLWPATDDAVSAATNDDSLVLRLEDGNEKLLLAGDIERPVERDLVADAGSLSADFLKVPHHGSKTSSTAPFLDAVHPRFAAISVGEANPFGHPSAEVIDRVSGEGARVFRTDRDGAITLITDGHNMEMHSFLGH